MSGGFSGPRRLGKSPIERARDIIAARLEGGHPDWKVAHGLYGWTAARPGDGRVLRSDSAPGLAVLLEIADRG